MSKQLVKGRIVRYVVSDQDYFVAYPDLTNNVEFTLSAVGKTRPAMVIDVVDGRPTLLVFTSADDKLPLFTKTGVEHDHEKLLLGTWLWPREDGG